MVYKISPHMPDEIVNENLEAYRRKAISMGAADAKVITVDRIRIDERVRAKCFVPACKSLGKNAHCPPHAPELDFVRKLVSRYHNGVFYMLKVSSEESAGREFREKRLGLEPAMRNWKISAKIESDAFHDGHYLAMGFAGGPCEPYLCEGKECNLLLGKGCRNPLLARPSMEAYGMDVFLMAAEADWDVYPIGGSTSPADIPHGTRFGLVLIC